MSRLEELIQKLCSDGAEYKKLGEVCMIETGKLNANANVADGRYMFFATAQEPSRIDSYRWDTEALLIAGNANIGDVKHYIGKSDAYQRTYVLHNFNAGVSARFLYHYIGAHLKPYLDKHKNIAAMTYIVLSSLEQFPVPIPPLPVQLEIVRILDHFSEMTEDIAKGLPAQIQARRWQYEHCRGRLLAFRHAA